MHSVKKTTKSIYCNKNVKKIEEKLEIDKKKDGNCKTHIIEGEECK